MRRFLLIPILVIGSWVSLSSHPITVDGDDSDWIGTPPPVDSYGVSLGEGIWTDAANDDLGDGGDAPFASDNPGGYTYPDTSLYTGDEADLLEWRVTPDLSNNTLNFLVRLGGFTELWQPIVVMTIDLDHQTGSGQVWLPQNADVQVSEENAWEYAVAIADGNILVFDANWQNVTGASQVALNPSTGVIEFSVDVSGWGTLPDHLYFTVASGLGEFGNFREVDSTSSLWYGAGGVGTDGTGNDPFWVDPDVYDLCFVSASDQPNDLNNYSDGTQGQPIAPAVIRPTTVQVVNLNALGIQEQSRWEPIRRRVVLAPDHGILTLYHLPEEARLLNLYDATGHLLRSFPIPPSSRDVVSLNIQSLRTGVYFLKVVGAQDTQSYRFIWVR